MCESVFARVRVCSRARVCVCLSGPHKYSAFPTVCTMHIGEACAHNILAADDVIVVGLRLLRFIGVYRIPRAMDLVKRYNPFSKNSRLQQQPHHHLTASGFSVFDWRAKKVEVTERELENLNQKIVSIGLRRASALLTAILLYKCYCNVIM